MKKSLRFLTSFSDGNIIKNVEVLFNSEVLENVSMIQDLIIAAIEKNKQHHSILKIKKQMRIKIYFNFKHIDDKNLNPKKAKQENYISIKLIKENMELFCLVLSRIFNFYIDKTSFPNPLKQADITLVHKKTTRMIKSTIEQSAFYLPCLKLSKSVCMIKFMLTRIAFFLRPNVVLEKTTVLSN